MLYHQGILNDLKAKVSDKETVSIGNTYRNIRSDLTKTIANEENERYEQVIREFPQLYSIKSSLYRAKAKKYPKIPISASETNVKDSWATTNRGQRFLVKKISKKIKL